MPIQSLNASRSRMQSGQQQDALSQGGWYVPALLKAMSPTLPTSQHHLIALVTPSSWSLAAGHGSSYRGTASLGGLRPHRHSLRVGLLSLL